MRPVFIVFFCSTLHYLVVPERTALQTRQLFFLTMRHVTSRHVPFFFFFQYLGEPAEVAREKERERSAGMAALKGCGFEAEEQRVALKRLCRCGAVPSRRCFSLVSLDNSQYSCSKIFWCKLITPKRAKRLLSEREKEREREMTDRRVVHFKNGAGNGSPSSLLKGGLPPSAVVCWLSAGKLSPITRQGQAIIEII